MFRAGLFISLVCGAGGCAELFADRGGYTPLNDVRCPLAAQRAGPLKFVTAPPVEPHEEKGIVQVIVAGTGAEATKDAIADLRREGPRHGCHRLRLSGTTIKPGDPYKKHSDMFVVDLLGNILFGDIDRTVVNASCLVLVSPTCDPAETDAAAAPDP